MGGPDGGETTPLLIAGSAGCPDMAVLKPFIAGAADTAEERTALLLAGTAGIAEETAV